MVCCSVQMAISRLIYYRQSHPGTGSLPKYVSFAISIIPRMFYIHLDLGKATSTSKINKACGPPSKSDILSEIKEHQNGYFIF